MGMQSPEQHWAVPSEISLQSPPGALQPRAMVHVPLGPQVMPEQQPMGPAVQGKP